MRQLKQMMIPIICAKMFPINQIVKKKLKNFIYIFIKKKKLWH